MITWNFVQYTEKKYCSISGNKRQIWDNFNNSKIIKGEKIINKSSIILLFLYHPPKSFSK